MKINTLQQKDANYPTSLSELTDAPKQLFTKGELSEGRRVAIIGSRKPSNYGVWCAQRLTNALCSHGVQIVSGLAYGIDSEVHKACVAAKGRTIAVMAGGLDEIYPNRHTELAQSIVGSGGALISEYPEGVRPRKHHFIARNRIIAGLAEVVIVVEATAKSGSLWTADFALQMGISVMAVPGQIDSPRSAGTNNLISQGAGIITSAKDVFNELKILPAQKEFSSDDPILNLLKNEPKSAETLANNLKLSYRDTLQQLSLLEIQGAIINRGDGHYTRRHT